MPVGYRQDLPPALVVPGDVDGAELEPAQIFCDIDDPYRKTSLALRVIVHDACRESVQPARVFGMNAIAVYVLDGITERLLYLIKITGADGETITANAWIYNNLFASWLGDLNGSLAYTSAFIIVIYLCMLPLYKKKIFIKI